MLPIIEDVTTNPLTQEIDLFGGSMFLLVPQVPMRRTESRGERATNVRTIEAALLERESDEKNDWELPTAA
jgi:hypothetical protein